MPLHQEVLSDLRRRILDGEWEVGSQVPSIASFQEHYGVRSMNTIRTAQQVLVEEGLLETRHGIGAFVVSLVPSPLPIEAELRAAKAALAEACAAVERSLRLVAAR